MQYGIDWEFHYLTQFKFSQNLLAQLLSTQKALKASDQKESYWALEYNKGLTSLETLREEQAQLQRRHQKFIESAAQAFDALRQEIELHKARIAHYQEIEARDVAEIAELKTTNDNYKRLQHIYNIVSDDLHALKLTKGVFLPAETAREMLRCFKAAKANGITAMEIDILEEALQKHDEPIE